MSGKIEVSRLAALSYKLRNVAVLINGQKAGEVGDGKSVSFDAQPGAYTIEARVDYLKSDPLQVEVAAGQTRAVELSMPPIWEALPASLGIGKLLRLRDAGAR